MGALRDFWRRGWIGKVVLSAAGLCGTLMLCCVALVTIALLAPSKPQAAVVTRPTAEPSNVQTVAVQHEADSTTAPTNLPTPTNIPSTSTPLPSPTDAPPTATPESTLVPTDVPTPLPTAQPKPTAKPAPPTAKPAPAVAVVAPTEKPASAPIPTAVDVGAAPCQPGQIKGNRNSKIYHAPGQRDYAKTYANVECFNTEAEAVAAGYRKAKR